MQGIKKTKIEFKEHINGISRDMEREFYRKVFLAQEEEKRRISQDLHDESGQIVIGLGATFNVIERELRAGNTERVLSLITESRDLVKTLSQKIRSLALILRPPALDVLGLSAVLREYFWQCGKVNALKIEFNENLKDEKFDGDMEITVYRIVQEALNNVLKHSGADIVKVDLVASDRKLTLIVADNGRGFDFLKYKNERSIVNFGLRGIGERVRMLNGKFSIESTLGEGTTLTISLPI